MGFATVDNFPSLYSFEFYWKLSREIERLFYS